MAHKHSACSECCMLSATVLPKLLNMNAQVRPGEAIFWDLFVCAYVHCRATGASSLNMKLPVQTASKQLETDSAAAGGKEE